jgi:hypothetical protein
MTDTIDPARHWSHCQCAACGQEEGLVLPEGPAMTEPKHIPLTKRWESGLDRLVRWLQTPDDALVEFADDVTEEEYR